MSHNILISIIIILAIVIISSVFLLQEKKFSLPDLELKPANISSVVDANNQFALDYYSKLREKNNKNIFFSPYSISNALAMTYEGARGQTSEEMRSVFYFPEDDNLRRTAYAVIINEINKKDKKYMLNTANALWAQKDYQFLSEYLSTVEKYYSGEVTNLDFKKDAEGSRITINNWVEDQTNDKIKDLIPSGVLNAMTRLVLTNAIYFKGEWVRQFNKDDTKEENFRTSEDSSVKALMMRRTDEEAKFNYAENDKLQMLEMPYSGEELSMLILLPKDDDLKGLENSFTVEQLSKWKKDLEEQRVKVFIPKFKFETKYLMVNDLRAMGMPLAFSDYADFSGMTGNKDLKIDEVIHQAFVEVNEEGTEAAAATGVVMGITSVGPGKEPPIPVFRADHPFIFLIQQNNTGNILFLGRVADTTL